MKFRSVMAITGVATLLAVGPASASGAVAAPASGNGTAIPVIAVGSTVTFASLDPSKFIEAGNVYGAFEGLMTYRPNGQPEPDLAQSVSTPNPTTYIFHLRRGVKFWDGDEMTSADVVNALDYYRRPGSQVNVGYTEVKTVDASGPYTVTVTMAHPDAAFLSWTCQLSPIFEKKFQQEHPNTMGNPSVGIMATGPYKLDSWDPTTGMELSANPHWWGGPVRVQHISVKFFANETSEALAFRAGDVNVAFPAGGSFAATAGVKVQWVPTDFEGYFSMNVHVAPWDNIHVRRAVAYALDRPDLVKALGTPGEAVTTFIPPDQLGELASPAQVNALVASLPSYPYNLAKAKAELALSPYPRGFTTSTNSCGYGSLTPVNEVIAAELAKIGIKLNIRVMPYTQWTNWSVGPKTDIGSLYTPWGTGSSDPSSFPSEILGSQNIPVGLGNSADYDPPVVDALIREGISTLDPAKRFAIYAKMLRIVANDLPYVALEVQDQGLALSSQYALPGFTQWMAGASSGWELALRRS
jgi:peptide/nickel transport system substrate-binding protein